MLYAMRGSAWRTTPSTAATGSLASSMETAATCNLGRAASTRSASVAACGTRPQRGPCFQKVTLVHHLALSQRYCRHMPTTSHYLTAIADTCPPPHTISALLQTHAHHLTLSQRYCRHICPPPQSSQTSSSSAHVRCCAAANSTAAWSGRIWWLEHLCTSRTPATCPAVQLWQQREGAGKGEAEVN
jgi:hypothetical protein